MNKFAESPTRKQINFIGNFASYPNRSQPRRRETIHPLLDLFDDVFRLDRHSVHGWLLRLGFLTIALGTFGKLVQFSGLFRLNNNLIGLWFGLSLFGITLLTIGLMRWVSTFKPHWNWVAITFFSMSAVLGVLILLVHVGILLPLPPDLEPAVVAALPEPLAPANSPTPTATVLATDVPTSTSTSSPTSSPTSAPTETHTTTAEPTSSPTPTEEPTVTPSATRIVVVPPTATPTSAIEFLDGYIHTVQQDETLSCIVENYYGTDQFVDTICRYNQSLDRMGEDCGESLAPGRRLAIPPADLVTFAFLPEVILPPHSPDACSFE